MMTDGLRELEKACLDLALAIKIVDQPITSDEARALAGKYVDMAISFTSEPLDIEPALIARAVRYLTHTHAIPPMRDDVQWFTNMLSALLEVARPNSVPDDKSKEFLKDMAEGIQSIIGEP